MSKRELLLLGLVLVGALFLVIKRKRAYPAFREWLLEPAAPVNLAVLRIVLFAVLFVTADYQQTLFFAELPDGLRYPPLFLDNVDWPLSPGITQMALILFKIFCVFGILGLFSRLSAGAATLLGIYVLGVPQFFGKVNHSHHLIWFAALLAVSRCGDALALDAIWHGWKRADKGNVAPPGPASGYGVPLKMAILLMGLMYFFPGFWKLYLVGPQWLEAGNMRNLMYNDWFAMGRWQPAVRVDQFPMLLLLGGIMTVAFEVFFLPLAVYRPTRWIALVGGLIFHNMTYLFLGIRFGTLQAMYVVLPDWRNLFDWIGKRLYKEPVVLLYDGTCSFCRRAIAAIRVFDVLGRVIYVPANHPEQWPEWVQGAPDREALQADIYSFHKGEWRKGTEAYATTVAQIPLLWITWPFLAIPPFKGSAARTYRRIADHRACAWIPNVPDPSLRVPWRPALYLGAVLFLGSFWFGVKHWVNAWPLAAYPSYAHVSAETSPALMFEVQRNGRREMLNPMLSGAMRDAFLPNRLNGLLQKMRQDEDPAIEDFFSVWQRVDSNVRNADLVGVWKAEYRNDPAAQTEVPVSLERLP